MTEPSQCACRDRAVVDARQPCVHAANWVLPLIRTGPGSEFAWTVAFPGSPFAFVCERAHLHHSDCVVLSANREALPMTDNQDTYTTAAPFWVVLLGLIIAIEIGALPVTRAMLRAVLP